MLSIPVDYAVRMKQTNGVSGSCVVTQKVADISMGPHLGYTKYCSFLSEWDSRSERFPRHQDWPLLQSLTPVEKHILHHSHSQNLIKGYLAKRKLH